MTTAVRPLDSLLVMAYIAQRAVKLGVYLNVTKLQKLMYTCYGACLAKFNVQISEEGPYAWQYGPVFPNALNETREYGIEPSLYLDLSIVEQEYPTEIKEMIDSVLRVFGPLTANQLVEWTHKKNSPWDITTGNGKKLYSRIPDSLISDYFVKYVLKN